VSVGQAASQSILFNSCLNQNRKKFLLLLFEALAMVHKK